MFQCTAGKYTIHRSYGSCVWPRVWQLALSFCVLDDKQLVGVEHWPVNIWMLGMVQHVSKLWHVLYGMYIYIYTYLQGYTVYGSINYVTTKDIPCLLVLHSFWVRRVEHATTSQSFDQLRPRKRTPGTWSQNDFQVRSFPCKWLQIGFIFRSPIRSLVFVFEGPKFVQIQLDDVHVNG